MDGDEDGGLEAGGDEVVLNGYGAGIERTEEDGEAEDEFEALLSKTMSESVEKTKIARATTQVGVFSVWVWGLLCATHVNRTAPLLYV